MKKLVMLCFAAALSSTANAFSGAELLGQCKNFEEIVKGGETNLKHTLQAGLCGGYVLGVQEGFIASSELSDIISEDLGIKSVERNYWDIPADVPDEQIVHIVIRYLEINPEMQKQPAVLSVINALRQTYPVKR
jgi:hypothetical protein